MGRRRILLVCTQMEAAGVQNRAVRLHARLRETGNDARLVFLYRKRAVFQDDDNRYCLFPRRPANPVDLLRILWRLFRTARRFRPDAVIGFAHYASPLAALAGVAGGARVRLGTQTNPPRTHKALSRALDWLCGTLGVYTGNIAASRAIETEFARYPRPYRRRLRLIHNGVPLSVSRLPRDVACEQFGINPDGFNLIACGRLSRQKNHAFLIETMRHVPGASLTILGEGELRPDLERAISRHGLEDRVRLYGEVEPARVPDFLRCGDVFVFPSLYEGFGLAVAEAMAASVPVICADHPALVEVVGDAGIVLPVGDLRMWAGQIERLRNDTGLRARLAQAGACRAQRFGFETMFEKYEAALNDGR